MHVDVGQCEGAARLTESEVDGFVGADHAGSRPADDDGRRRGVGQGGVVVDVDDVVGFNRGAGHTADVGVEVGVVGGVGELARLHTNAGQARAVGSGREGGGVVGVAACGVTAGEHGCKVGECAAHHIDVGQSERGAGFTEGEGDFIAATGRQVAAAFAAERNDRRRVVGRNGVVGQCDLVVGLNNMAADAVGAGRVGVQVLVACVVAEFSGGHTDGGCARAVGCRREAGGVLGVAGARRPAGGHRGEVAERAACDGDVAHVKVHRGFGQGEGDGFVGAAGQRGACMGAGHDDGGRCGVGGDGVVGEADLVVGLQRGAGRRRVHVGVLVVVARCVAEHAGLDADGGRACGVGCGGEGSGVDTWADLAPIAKGATADVHIALHEVGAGLRQREGDRGGLACAEGALVDGDRDGRRRGVGRERVGGGVVAQADLVVGLGGGPRWCRAEVGVLVVVACRVGELAAGHANGGGAGGVGCGREGGGVLLVASA